MIFAETKKPDTGGTFWVPSKHLALAYFCSFLVLLLADAGSKALKLRGFRVIFAEVKSLRHIYLGLLVYILLMVGLLSRSSPVREPPAVAAAALIALAIGYARFRGRAGATIESCDIRCT